MGLSIQTAGQWVKRHKILTSLTIILLLSGTAIGYLWYPPLWTYFVVTDPHNPKFDPLKFRFEYYRSHKEFAEFARVHFPIGTPKTFVDEALVGSGGADPIEMKFEDRESIPGFGHGYHLKDQFTDFKAKYSVSYRYPGKTKLFMWAITAYYDDQDKLKLMMAKDIFVHDPVNN